MKSHHKVAFGIHSKLFHPVNFLLPYQSALTVVVAVVRGISQAVDDAIFVGGTRGAYQDLDDDVVGGACPRRGWDVNVVIEVDGWDTSAVSCLLFKMV